MFFYYVILGLLFNVACLDTRVWGLPSVFYSTKVDAESYVLRLSVDNQSRFSNQGTSVVGDWPLFEKIYKMGQKMVSQLAI